MRAEVEGRAWQGSLAPYAQALGEMGTRSRLGQTGDSSVLHSVRTEAAPRALVSGDPLPLSLMAPHAHVPGRRAQLPLTLQAGLSAGPGAYVRPPG